MLYNRYTGNKIIAISFYTLVFYLIFDFVLAQTVFKSQMLIYFMMIFNLLSISFCVIQYGCESNRYSRMWVAYLCLHIISLFLNGNVTSLPYWIIALLMLFIPSQIVGVFKSKIFVYIGLFFAGGVFLQYLLPSSYQSYVSSYFIGDASDFIENALSNEFGFSGFSPQTGTTAYILLICLSVLLAFKDEQGGMNRKFVRYTILFVLVLAIFLTGKRMHSLISVVLLLLSLYFSISSKNKIRDILVLLIILGGVYALFQYFISNIDQYADNVFLKRFASSYTESSSGADISSGRDILYQKAWELYQQEPMLGIGANNFNKIGNMGTSVHNTYLQVLCEEGLLRFPLFIIPLLIIFFKTLKEIFKNRIIESRSFLLLSFFLQFVFILYSFTGNTIVNNSNFVFYFMGVGLFAYSLRYR